MCKALTNYLVQGYRFRSDETWQDVELFPREYPLHNRGVAQNRADAFVAAKAE